jgi:DNA polymerase-3 subunit alpha
MKAIDKHRDKQYRERVEYEFAMIAEKGFSGYFLVQHALIEAVRRELGVEIGPGRGSVGGCLIAYLMGITEIDPLVHGTLFERFLTPSRGGKLMQCSLH